MPKFGGSGSLSLFSVQGNIERELQLMSIDRIRETLGLEKVVSKKVGNFDLPTIPVQEDFFMFPFRLLSKTIVGSGSWKSTDFSKGTALKESVGKVAGKPAYLNHDQYAGREIGYLGDAEWENAYTLNGKPVPAGIGGPFVLNKHLQGSAGMPSNADLILRLSGPVPMIKACSMSVEFEWEPSHDFEHEYDFYYNIGEMIDGKEVTRVVLNVNDYGEGSLVYQGADPFAKSKTEDGKIMSYAKMLDNDGTIVEIDKSSAFARKKFGRDGVGSYDSGKRFYIFDSLDQDFFLTLSKSNEKKVPKPENIIPMNEELLAFIAAGFGITVEDLKANKFDKAKAEKFKIIGGDAFAKLKSEEDFNTITKAKEKAEADLATMKVDKEKFEKEVTDLTTAKKALEPFAKVGEDVLKLSRDEAKRAYGLSMKGKPDQVIIDELNAEVDFAKLNAKIAAFGGKAVTEYGGTCSACGSTEISFRSSKQQEENPPAGGGKVKGHDDSLERAAYRG